MLGYPWLISLTRADEWSECEPAMLAAVPQITELQLNDWQFFFVGQESFVCHFGSKILIAIAFPLHVHTTVYRTKFEVYARITSHYCID